MIDAVLSLHQNPATCGVAKFSAQLAQRLGVRLRPLIRNPIIEAYFDKPPRHPLVSVKFSELTAWHFCALTEWRFKAYDLFLHDAPPKGARTLIVGADRVYAANREIWDALRVDYTNVVPAFCPSTVDGNPTRGAYRVLVFGMAHKLLLPHFERLRSELDEASIEDYTVELSTAVHEGSPWDVALTESVEAMRGIFGDRLRVLGFLGDDALAKELQDVDAVAAFYQPALRANNTTYWAAVAAGKRIFTNRDEHSPQEGDPPATWDRLLEIIRA